MNIDDTVLVSVHKAITEAVNCNICELRIIDEDRKRYCIVVLLNGKKYLLKIVYLPKNKYCVYVDINALDIDCFQKTEFILPYNKENMYIVLAEWIDGMILGKMCPDINNEKFRNYVFESAKTLRSVHNNNRRTEKVNFSEEQIKCATDFDFINDAQKKIITEYLLKNLSEINGRQITVLHGDMHIDNILCTNKGTVFIDIDDVSCGDPYFDLVYVANIHRMHSEDPVYYLFLQYYFDFRIPKYFWNIVNCYSLRKLLHIINVEVHSSKKLRSMASLDKFLNEHIGMTEDVPIWFKHMDEKFREWKKHKC